MLQLSRAVRAAGLEDFCCPVRTSLSSLPQVCIASAFTMITPAFDLSQDPDYLILNIRVPYTRTSDFDVYIDGADFKFYAKPYFLR